MDFRLVESLSDELRDAVFAPLREHNLSQNPQFFTARDLPENAPRPLNILAYDSDGTVIGGLMADTQFIWLKVSIMSVAQHVRLRGVGRQLLTLAEQEARARGCRRLYVDTMNYQAPAFYRKLGYQQVGELADWDSHGHTKYLFTKQALVTHQ